MANLSPLMIPFLRNLFAGSAGALVSMPANMLLLGPMAKLTGAPMLPEPPAGAELAEVQAFYAPMIAAMEPIHFAGPILAHWNGAFVGALVAGLLTHNKSPWPPMLVAGFVMLGGIVMAIFTSSQPLWSMVLDLAGYLPMGWLGMMLAHRLRPASKASTGGLKVFR